MKTYRFRKLTFENILVRGVDFVCSPDYLEVRKTPDSGSFFTYNKEIDFDIINAFGGIEWEEMGSSSYKWLPLDSETENPVYFVRRVCMNRCMDTYA